jgi:flagellar hook-length control protein FliK
MLANALPGSTKAAAAAAGTADAGFAAIAATALKAAGVADSAGAAQADAGGASVVPGAGTAALPADSAVATALSQLSAPGATPHDRATAPIQAQIATRVEDADFGVAVSRQLVSLARTGVQSAQLVLNPAHLGPVSVSIQMSGQQASLSMSAEHEATRTALREALPHLDTLFAQSGLQLGSAHVGDGSERHSGRQGTPAERPAAPFAPTGPRAPGATNAPATTRTTPIAGLVDTFV